MVIKRFCLSGLTALCAVLLVTGCGPKEPESGAAAELPAELADNPGAVLFSDNCQSCHGVYATGNGPLAAELSTPPPDLTRLIDKYGMFPEELVAMTIDGRAEVESHGSREMPVWGNVWNDPSGGPLAEERVNEQIQQLVEYLRAIQAPATEPMN